MSAFQLLYFASPISCAGARDAVKSTPGILPVGSFCRRGPVTHSSAPAIRSALRLTDRANVTTGAIPRARGCLSHVSRVLSLSIRTATVFILPRRLVGCASTLKGMETHCSCRGRPPVQQMPSLLWTAMATARLTMALSCSATSRRSHLLQTQMAFWPWRSSTSPRTGGTGTGSLTTKTQSIRSFCSGSTITTMGSLNQMNCIV